MFDLAWSEIALIAVVAVVVIGPKDLPDAVKNVAKGVRKLRQMAGQFQGQLDEVVREANLHEVRNSINEIRNFDIKGEIEKHVDADGSLRKTISEDPIKDSDPAKAAVLDPSPQTTAPVTEVSLSEMPPVGPVGEAPAFIPPEEAAKAQPLPPIPEVALPDVPPPPAFMPPSFVPPASVTAGEAQEAGKTLAEAKPEQKLAESSIATASHPAETPAASTATGPVPEAKPTTQS
ncbi:twin-arginine translocase subunit TatB [Acetobacteraceae bacterium H6797]|nr:twin-arginine translocase subunit TatB [Acetobacteraceae bacterium H6797]